MKLIALTILASTLCRSSHALECGCPPIDGPNQTKITHSIDLSDIKKGKESTTHYALEVKHNTIYHLNITCKTGYSNPREEAIDAFRKECIVIAEQLCKNLKSEIKPINHDAIATRVTEGCNVISTIYFLQCRIPIHFDRKDTALASQVIQ